MLFDTFLLKRTRLCLGVLCGPLLCSWFVWAAVADWPQWRGPGGQGHVEPDRSLPVEWSEEKNVVWKTPVPGRGWSSPVIQGNEIWMTTAFETAASEEEMKERLRTNTGDQEVTVLSSVTIHAVCVDKTTGKILKNIKVIHKDRPQWVHKLNSYASCTPVLKDGRLYIHNGAFGTACLDTESGKVLWLNQDLWVMHENGPGSTPVLWNDLLIFHMDGSDQQFIVALDASTGAVRWQVDRSGELPEHVQLKKSYGTSVVMEVGGKDILFSPATNWLYGYNPQTGEELWKVNYETLGFSVVPKPVWDEERFYLITGFMRPQLLAFAYRTQGPPVIKWRYAKGVPTMPSPILVGEEIYIVSDSGGVVTCLDARSGEEIWRERIHGNYSASPLVADGKLYFHSREGITTVIEAGREFKVLSRNQLDGKHMASAAVDGNRIILRTDKALYCIEETKSVATHYEAHVEPILINYCYDCHGDGSDKGQVAMDGFKNHTDRLEDKEFWFNVLKNLRAGLMPPSGKPRPDDREQSRIEEWILADVFETDFEQPDPGSVTLRRLNRVEYQNTVRDLMGIEFRAYEEFPPDDTGYGFDHIGDVLSISPLLVEKYLEAAKSIVEKAVPTVTRQVQSHVIKGSDIKDETGDLRAERLSFYEPAYLTKEVDIAQEGDYRILVKATIHGSFDFDPGQCQFSLTLDGEDLIREKYVWQDRFLLEQTFERRLTQGRHKLVLQLDPLVEKGNRDTHVTYRLSTIEFEGPLADEHWVHPPRYDLFFTRPEPPTSEKDKKAYAFEVLDRFVLRAFRRPMGEDYIQRLVAMAEEVYRQEDVTFEKGIAQSMIAVLASPRFVYRMEGTLPTVGDRKHPLLDDYALATRLSYFLWSTMPDDVLFALAKEGRLREDLDNQVARMLKDPRSSALIKNFVGQWLQVRDVESIQINGRVVMARDTGKDREMERIRAEYNTLRAIAPEKRTPEQEEKFQELRQQRIQLFRQPTIELTGDLRRAMKQETEMLFEHVMREDLSVLELLDSNYTFLNDKLAEHYGIEGVKGNHMRKVALEEDSPRGGVLTQGSVLVVTSNPTRTSPVKRGLFVLESILGTPAPPPPGDVPDLEASEEAITDHEPTLREALELHRDQALCRSCHQRMDPLGFALENFNALGLWRDTERGQPIQPSGELITGESFEDVRDLKKILVRDRKSDFYRCLTEKLLVYAIGRGLEYYDTYNVDKIVAVMEANEGRFSALLNGVLDSAPFQSRRSDQKWVSQSKPFL